MIWSSEIMRIRTVGLWPRKAPGRYTDGHIITKLHWNEMSF